MMNTERDRYKIEYEIIPEYMHSNQASDFVQTILIKKHYLILEMYQLLNENNPDYVCPYTPKDFDVDAVVVGNIAGIMRIKMPQAQYPGDVISMYFCHDANIGRIRLYSVRLDQDGDTCFMSWVDDSHYMNHGKFKLSEEQEMKTVVEMYMKFLTSNS